MRKLIALGATSLLAMMALFAASASPATAQGSVPPVANIELRNGPNSGEVIISWDAVAQATHYRIGYVNMEVDYHLAKASCTGEWIGAFVYIDVNARNIPLRNGRAEYIVRRIAPGARHAFTVLTSNDFADSGSGGSVRSEFFWPSNPRWTFLDGRRELPAGMTLPTGECAELASAQTDPPPTGNVGLRDGNNPGEVVISWDAVAQATHYRIGYVNMEVDYHLAKASCTGEWIGAFVYIDVNARNIPVRNGRAEYTIRRLSPGARHAFTVLTSNDFDDSGGGGSVRSEFFWPSNPRWKFLDGRSALPAGMTLPAPDCYGGPGGDADASTDRAALVALYNATNGDNWGNNTNWLSDVPGGQWHGVTTDASGRVTEIDLSENGLTGPIPPQLGRLSNLTELHLWGNELTGPVPAWLGTMTNLEVLALSINRLDGTIPPELQRLSNLTELYLGGNELTGPVPAWLGTMTNLEVLALSTNRLDGTIPPELQRLSNLTTLSLWGNELSGTVPAGLGNLSNLEFLWIGDNQLTGTMPPELGRLSNLKELNLTRNRLTGSVPAWLGGLTNLEVLALGGNRLDGTIPPELQRLSNLTKLYLWGNELTGPVPAWLGGLTNLERLHLSGNQLTGEIPAALGSLANLTELRLYGNQLTGEIPAELGSLANLIHLDLARNQLTGEIPAELGSLANLESLVLSGNQLTGEIPAELGSLANLIFLYLYVNQLTGEIPAALGSLANLESLSLSDNQLTGDLPRSLTNLTTLTRFIFSDNAGLCAPNDAAFQSWLNSIDSVRGPTCP